MSDINKFTTKEVLNKVLLDSSGNAVEAFSHTTQEALNAALDTTNNRLNVSLNGGTISGDVTIEGDLTVNGSATNSYDEIVNGDLHVKSDATNSTSAFLVEQNDGTDVFIVDTANSRVGIGVSSPESNLSFEPALVTASTEGIKFQNAGDDNDAIIQPWRFASGMGMVLGSNFFLNTSGAVARFKGADESVGVLLDPRGTFDIYTGASGVDATSKLRINNDGNVGIGTTNPNSLLEASGTSAIRSTYTGTSSAGVGGALQLVQDDGSAIESGHRIGYVVFGASEDSSNTIHYGGSINAFATETYSASGNGTKLTFDVTANGATSRSTALTIDQDRNATFAGDITSDGNLKLRSGSGRNIYFTEADGTVDEMSIGYDQANQRLRFRSNAHSLDRMLITKTGQVGINIVPATTLNVASPVSANVTTFPTLRLTSQTETADWDAGDVNGAFEFYTADTSGNAPYVNAFIKSINEQENGTLPSGSLSFGTATYNEVGGAVERMRIDSLGNSIFSGNVKVLNTSAPSIRLNPDASDATDSHRAFIGYATGNDNFITGTVDNDLAIRSSATGNIVFGRGTTESMRIDSSGNVGIGGSPHVNSTLNVKNSSGTAFLYITSANDFDSAIVLEEASTAKWIIGNDGNDSDKLKFGTGGGWGTETRMTLDSSGNLVVGQTTAQQKFEVHGGGIRIAGNIATPSSGVTGALIDYFGSDTRFWSRGADASTVGSFKFIGLENDGGNQSTFFILDSNSRISLSNNDSGSSNTLFGFQAGNAIADAGNTGNVLIGHNAGKIANNANFQYNVAMGYATLQSVGSRNLQHVVAIGANTMRSCDSGAPDGTVAIGSSSLYNLSSGANNVAMGYQSGDTITTGSGNTIIGTYADAGANAQNQIVIGHNVTGLADNSVTLGNASVTNVYLSTDRDARLHCGGVDLGEAVDSSDAEVLDDYEEGIFTPAIWYQNADDLTNSTNVTQTGVFTKIGNVCHFELYLKWNADDPRAGDNIGITGMPFTAKNTTSLRPVFPVIVNGSSLSTDDVINGSIGANTTRITFTGVNGNEESNMGDDFGENDNMEVSISGSYIVE